NVSRGEKPSSDSSVWISDSRHDWSGFRCHSSFSGTEPAESVPLARTEQAATRAVTIDGVFMDKSLITNENGSCTLEELLMSYPIYSTSGSARRRKNARGCSGSDSVATCCFCSGVSSAVCISTSPEDQWTRSTLVSTCRTT